MHLNNVHILSTPIRKHKLSFLQKCISELLEMTPMKVFGLIT